MDIPHVFHTLFHTCGKPVKNSFHKSFFSVDRQWQSQCKESRFCLWRILFHACGNAPEFRYSFAPPDGFSTDISNLVDWKTSFRLAWIHILPFSEGESKKGLAFPQFLPSKKDRTPPLLRASDSGLVLVPSVLFRFSTVSTPYNIITIIINLSILSFPPRE